ncbi:hypothetical protein BDF21DRAFT_417082 [Thamnidium elegans]|nr:hypothetical protein BDF21DRAFT_417082 [Thamnidium elegans]
MHSFFAISLGSALCISNLKGQLLFSFWVDNSTYNIFTILNLLLPYSTLVSTTSRIKNF